MTCYVINLDRDPDRRAFMDRQFERVAIRAERVRAIDARQLTPEARARYATLYSERNYHGAWSVNYMACFLSHREAWKRIAHDPDPFGIVFEDDVHLSPQAADVIAALARWPASFDIVRLETTLQGMTLRRDAVRCGPARIRPAVRGAWGAAAYALPREVAGWLAAAPHRLHGTPDWMLFHRVSPLARVLRTGQVVPAPCVQDQYHPDPTARLHFAMETKAADDTPTLRGNLRRLMRPAARKLLGREAVAFG